MKKILVITPTAHILGLNEIIESIPNSAIKYFPECTYTQFNSQSDADVIFTNPNKSNIYLGSKELKLFSNLEVIVTASTGTNHIDKNYCEVNDIKVISLTNERHVINQISSTAEHAFCLSMMAIRNSYAAAKSVQSKSWDYEPYVGRQFRELTIGVIGYGRLGRFYSHYCDSFGSRVIVYDPYKDVAHPRITQVNSLTELANKSDLVSIHVHVSSETIGLVDSEFFSACKEELYLINTSRGDIVNEQDLVQFLKINPKSKYATDVLADEINGVSNNCVIDFWNQHSNQVVITPHIAGMTREGQSIAYCHAAKLLLEFLNNKV